MDIIKDKVNKTITYDYGNSDIYKKVVHGCYSAESDITFIMSDIIEKETGSCIITEVTGFYFGTPNIEYIEKYNGKLKAKF